MSASVKVDPEGRPRRGTRRPRLAHADAAEPRSTAGDSVLCDPVGDRSVAADQAAAGL